MLQGYLNPGSAYMIKENKEPFSLLVRDGYYFQPTRVHMTDINNIVSTARLIYLSPAGGSMDSLPIVVIPKVHVNVLVE